LSGLAILGVFLNHSNWHILGRFSPGDLPGYFFLPLDQAGKFGVMAFLFMAGYFIAYATNGGKADLRWSIVQARLATLVWPWLIWSGLIMIGQTFQGRGISLEDYAGDLFIQYYFVPLLMFYYLLAPLFVRWGRAHARTLLGVMAAVQLTGMLVFYARYYWAPFPEALWPWVDLGPLDYLRFAFFFPLGLTVGMFPDQAKGRLAGWKPFLPWLTFLFFGLSVLETAQAYRLGGGLWPGAGDQTKLTSVLFSVALISCFVVADKLTVPFKRFVVTLGSHTYGYYLAHYVILGIVGRVIQRFWPWLDAQEWLLGLVLFSLTTSLSMLLIEGWARLPVINRFHRYLFG
jgi:peptidoglycan/LPS O-acetylase OafA/YrhL